MLQKGKAAIKSDFICKGWIIDTYQRNMAWHDMGVVQEGNMVLF